MKMDFHLVLICNRAEYLRGKGLLYPLDRRLGWPQSRSGHGGLRKNPFASAEDRTPIARSSVI
jgi:hypothetical protein